MRTDPGRPRLWMGVAFDTLVSVTRPDGSELDLAPSLDIQNHSPTGWGWGYAGSGPAQLALALLLDASGDPDIALEHYQDFKYAFVARWPWPGGWTLSPAEAAAWIEERLAL